MMNLRIFKMFDEIKMKFRILSDIGIKASSFILPIFFSLTSSVFEGLAMILLMPTIKGLLEGEYFFIKDVLEQKAPFIDWGPLFLGNSRIFYLLLALIFLAIVLKNTFLYMARILVVIHVQKFANQLRQKIYGRYLLFGKSFFDQHNAGQLQQILLGFTNRVSSEISNLNGNMVSIFNLFIYVGMMFWISPLLSLWSMLIFPILYFSIRKIINKIKRSSEDYTKNYTLLSKKISNALQCMPLIKIYAMQKREREWFAFSSSEVERCEISIHKKNCFIGPFQEVIIYMGLLLLIGGVAYLVIPQKMSDVTKFLVFFLILRRAMGMFGAFNHMFSSLASITGPFRQIKELLNADQKFILQDGQKEMQAFGHAIEFKNVTFKYPQSLAQENVLYDINITIPKGKMFAIVGGSGSGKTTLVSLLLRFYELQQGSICIDRIDIKQYTLTSLYQHMALVSQDVYLFNASFKFNLMYGLRTEPSVEETKQALKNVNLLELVESWPLGMETPIGDYGVNLSGGERQRLSIARALLKKADILILDEATSALDSITEKFIQEKLKTLIQTKTTIVIAHRLSTIQQADHIIVLDKGKMIEQGNVQQLLDQKGKFFEYWKQQKFLG